MPSARVASITGGAGLRVRMRASCSAVGLPAFTPLETTARSTGLYGNQISAKAPAVLYQQWLPPRHTAAELLNCC